MRILARPINMQRHHAVAFLSIFSTSSSFPIGGLCREDYCRPIFQGPIFQSRHRYRSTTTGFAVPFCDLLSHPRNINGRLQHVLNQERHIVVGRRSTSLYESSVSNYDSLDPRSLAQDAFNILARKGRSWRRLGHIVDLAVEGDTTSIRSIADIGCDHGLLAVGLSVTGCFDHVIGVDVSEQALEDGGISLHKEVLHILRTNTEKEEENQSNGHNYETSDQQLIPVEFRVGDGLKVLQPTEADVVCIAGMGINTMLNILTDSELSRLDCQKLILQPTNTKPRNLVQLYDELQNMGWVVMDERIEELSSRWYISTRFEKKTSDAEGLTVRLPGEILRSLKDDHPMRVVYNDYVGLHRSWLDKDLKRAGHLHNNEVRWLETNK